MSEPSKLPLPLPRLTLRDDHVVTGAAAWAKAVHEYAKEKGWWKDGVGNRNLPEIFLLIKSEIIEAHEEWRKKGATLTGIYESDVGLSVVNYIDHRTDVYKTKSEGVPKPEGVPIELADCAIRIFDTVYALASMHDDLSVPDWWTVDSVIVAENVGEAFDDILLMIGAARKVYLEEAGGGERGKHDAAKWTIIALLRVLSQLFFFAKEKDIDLASAIERKHAFNLTRSYRHGDKKA